MGVARLFGVISFFAVSHHSVQAVQSVNLAWDASPDASVVGYRIYDGVTSRTYTNTMTFGNATNATIFGLIEGVTYYFAVTAYNSVGLESAFSNEATYTPPATNTAPAIAAIANQTINAGGTTGPIPFTVGDIETVAGSLTVSGSSSNPGLVPASNIVFGGGGSNRTVTVSPAPGQTGTTVSTVTVSDGQLSSSASFTLTVNAVKPPPVAALISPSPGTTYTAPATISVAASVITNGHSIIKVQFYDGAALLGENTGTLCSWTWSKVNAGSYSLTARAVYDAGSTVDSSPVNISVTGLPAPWQTTDIGSVGVVGSTSVSNGIYAVQGAGNISGTADNFRFAYQPLSGDGEIEVCLNSLGDIGTSGCLGVMVRESLTRSSECAFMGISFDGTFRWQRRSRTGGSTSSTTSTIGTPPNVWTRLVRTGNTLAGYKSTDGINWTLVNSRNFNMASNIYIGLAVASGSPNTLSTATFTKVTVVP